jgi:hypothetical protein
MLVCGVARASTLLSPSPVNLGARLFARCFGESTDRLASFSAVTGGDATAESPLRDLALRFDAQAPVLAGVKTVRVPFIDANLFLKPSFSAPVINLSDPAYRPPSLHVDSMEASVRVLHAPVIGYYQSAAPAPTDAPLSHRFGLGAFQVDNVQPSFGFTSSDVGSPLDAHAAAVNGPVHVGRVHFSPHAEAEFSQDAQPSLGDRSLSAGTTLDVRAGQRNFGVDLSSGVEHVTLAQPQYSTSSVPNVGLTGEALPVFVPAYADVSAHTISTGVTVPVTRSLSASVQYDMQHLLSANGVTPGLNMLDANNTMVGAQVTFKLPKGLSAISLSARQFHYQDNLVPSAAVTQTNANLNYTVKF